MKVLVQEAHRRWRCSPLSFVVVRIDDNDLFEPVHVDITLGRDTLPNGISHITANTFTSLSVCIGEEHLIGEEANVYYKRKNAKTRAPRDLWAFLFVIIRNAALWVPLFERRINSAAQKQREVARRKWIQQQNKIFFLISSGGFGAAVAHT